MSLHDLESEIFERVMGMPDNVAYPYTFRLGDGRSVATLTIDACPYRGGHAFLPVSLGAVKLTTWAELRDRATYLRVGIDPGRVRLDPPPADLAVGQADLARALGVKAAEFRDLRRLGLFPAPDTQVGKRPKWFWTNELACKVAEFRAERERD